MLSVIRYRLETDTGTDLMGDFVIIGSGVAGHRAAAELHRLDPSQSVYVVGTEPGAPYDRPPLSKEYLKTTEPVRPDLGPAEIYKSNVTLRDGLTATSIDRPNQTIALSDGSSIQYDRLLLATGSRLRHLDLPNIDPARVFYLRTILDAQRLRTALDNHLRIAIIGGGFVGLEIAAAAKRNGCTVTLLERAPELLSRGATPPLAEFARKMHSRQDVRIFLGINISEAFQDGSDIVLRWPEGEVRSDILVVGVGIIPNIELALQCGLATADGILVDQQCRTSDEWIFAAGEVTSYPVDRLGVHIRTESWSSASAQGTVAATSMLGRNGMFNELPWFWSDQYDCNIQCLGLPKRASRFHQIGDLNSESWLRIGVDDAGSLVGAESVNKGREMSALRRADRRGEPIPTALIKDSILVQSCSTVGDLGAGSASLNVNVRTQ